MTYPTALPVHPDNIPDELKHKDQWCVWKYEKTKGNKWTKIPYQAKAGLQGTAVKAKSNDATTWSSYNDALAAYRLEPVVDAMPYDKMGFSGIGFFLSPDNDLMGVDLDNVLEDERIINDDARTIVEALGSYTEISPSGKGLRIFVSGAKPGKRSRKAWLEIYDGTGARYLTVTGQVYHNAPIRQCQTEIEEIYKRYLNKLSDTQPDKQPTQPRVSSSHNLNDSELLVKMFSSAKGADIKALYDGITSGYSSSSEADLALTNRLAWWCDYDPVSIDSLFRQSALYRPKWDERHSGDGATYGELTILKACDGKARGDGYDTKSKKTKTPLTTSIKETEGEDAEDADPDTIVVNGRHLHEITDQCLEVLQRHNAPPKIFTRGNMPVRIYNGGIQPFDTVSLRGYLDRTATFVKRVVQGGVEIDFPARPPSDVPPDILRLSSLPFPELDGISNVPIVRGDGSILSTNGYDQETQLLLELTGLDSLDTHMPTSKAVNLFRDLFIDFPFADAEAGFAHAIALILQSFLRLLIAGPTPLYLVDAPTRGSGKGLLVDVIVRIITGMPAPVMALPRDNDELEKRITSKLLTAPSFVFFDNVLKLESTALAAALTSEIWNGRLLGKSEMLCLPNTASWVATGNNVDLSDEIARRCIPIRLDPGIARPEHRTGFRHPNIKRYALEQRSQFVSAALSMIQAWINEGMPRATDTLGTFESWAEIIGGVCSVCGVSGFLSSRERLYDDADATTQDWTHVTRIWFEHHAEHPISAGDLFTILKQSQLLLELWAGRNDISAQQRVGHALRQKRDRVFGEYQILATGLDSRSKNNTYRLRWCQKKTPETPETPVASPSSAVFTGVSGVSQPYQQEQKNNDEAVEL
jgi:primase-polymerase (primpol)-like protein